MNNIFKKIIDDLTNCVCNDFHVIEGGGLIIYLKELNNISSTGKRLWIDCAWRLQNAGIINIGSLDESSMILERLTSIIGKQIQSVSICGISGDLKLCLSNEIIFQTFGYAVVDELWELRDPLGVRMGVGPGFEAFERLESPDSKSS